MIYIETIAGQDLRPNQSELFRYLGCKELPNPEMQELVHSIWKELQTACTPKACFCIQKPEAWMTKSQDLFKIIKPCETVLLLCATVGSGADRLMQKYMRVSPAKAAIVQGVSTAMVEEWCDMLCKKVACTLKQKGQNLTTRFSPGYGDFPLENQERLLNRLEASRNLGIHLTDSFMMYPTKTVSAICGITTQPIENKKTSCENCNHKTCCFRL